MKSLCWDYPSKEKDKNTSSHYFTAYTSPFLMATTPEAYVHLSTDETILTFYYDTLRADRDGTTWGISDRYKKKYKKKILRSISVPAWCGDWPFPNTTVLVAVFDASFRDFRSTTTARWFYCLASLESIEGLEHLNTSQLTDMG